MKRYLIIHEDGSIGQRDFLTIADKVEFLQLDSSIIDMQTGKFLVTMTSDIFTWKTIDSEPVYEDKLDANSKCSDSWRIES